MKIIITGASGLLGREVMREFTKNTRFDVIGTAFSRSGGSLIKLNLLNMNEVDNFIVKEKPDYIIHCAAERKPDVSQKDPEGTIKLNVRATEQLARIAEKLGSWILYMSTDYVFDGTKPPYTPESKPNPLNFYRESKLNGEKAIWKLTNSACVLRVPILYGSVESLEECPVTVIAKNLQSNTPQKMDNWAIRYPTHVEDVSYVIRQIIENKIRGTYHWSGNEAFTKYQMAIVMAEIIGMSKDNIIPDENPPQGAPRPKDSHLNCSDLESLGIGKRTPFNEGIKKVLDTFITGQRSTNAEHN